MPDSEQQQGAAALALAKSRPLSAKRGVHILAYFAYVFHAYISCIFSHIFLHINAYECTGEIPLVTMYFCISSSVHFLCIFMHILICKCIFQHIVHIYAYKHMFMHILKNAYLCILTISSWFASAYL